MEYPNLKGIETTLLIEISKNDEYSKIPENAAFSTIKADMFEQVWPTTAGGFAGPDIFAGQAFTSEYTTVIKASYGLTKEDSLMYENIVFAGVFFGNKLAYIIVNPDNVFDRDLADRKIASQYDAYSKYKGFMTAKSNR